MNEKTDFDNVRKRNGNFFHHFILPFVLFLPRISNAKIMQENAEAQKLPSQKQKRPAQNVKRKSKTLQKYSQLKTFAMIYLFVCAQFIYEKTWLYFKLGLRLIFPVLSTKILILNLKCFLLFISQRPHKICKDAT
jgi:hypothetical protein